jgi:drug/metabolite transporter (DMT)-like permease
LKLSTQAQGLLITTAGVLAISPDTLLVRLLNLEKWSLLFYRGIILAVCLSLLTLLLNGKKTPEQFRKIGLPGLLIALLFTGSTICFVSSLYYTSVANTLIIVSASSMFAALYSRFLLQEQIPLRTLITMVVVIGSISYIVSDSLGGGSLKGDLLAVFSSMFIAGAFTVTRRTRACNMIPASALSGLLTAVICYFPASFEPLDLRSSLLMLLLGITLATAFALLTLGPRYISAPEVSLLMQLETVLGPLLIWLIIGEQPANAALLGGTIVITALALHSLLGLRAQARPMQ